MHVVQSDGTEADVEAGKAYVIEPGHDAWIVGDDVFVGYEFESKTVENYAVGSGEQSAAQARPITTERSRRLVTPSFTRPGTGIRPQLG
jgi:hypothetical protein